jgi:hypothetical protein
MNLQLFFEMLLEKPKMKRKESILWFCVCTVIYFEKLDLHVKWTCINARSIFKVGGNAFLERVLNWCIYFLPRRVICIEVFIRMAVHAFLYQLCASTEF